MSEKANMAGEKMKSAANSAANFTKDSANSVYTHYQNGTLGDAAHAKA